jgi:hypothetical protein
LKFSSISSSSQVLAMPREILIINKVCNLSV